MTFFSSKQFKRAFYILAVSVLALPLFAQGMDIVDPVSKMIWEINPVQKKVGCMIFSSESVCQENSAAAQLTGREDPTKCKEIQAKIGKLAIALDRVNLELESTRRSIAAAQALLATTLANRPINSGNNSAGTTSTTPVNTATSTATTTQAVKEADMILSVTPGEVRAGESLNISGKINSNTTYYNLEIYKDGKLYSTLFSNTFITQGARPFTFQKSYITTTSMPVGEYQLKLSDTYFKSTFAVVSLQVLPKTTVVTNTKASNSYQYVGPAGSTLTPTKVTTPAASKSTNYVTFTKPFIGAQVQANRGFVISWAFSGPKGKRMDVYADASCDASDKCTIGSNNRISVVKNVKISDKGFAWWVPSALAGKQVKLYAEQAGQPIGSGLLFNVVKSIHY